MPRDNLLNSACLELFEYVKRENIKPIIVHLVEKYRDKLKSITYVDTFQNIILRYDQMQGYGAAADTTLWSQDEPTTTASPPRNMIMGGQRWHGVRGMDAAEEEYFDASDEEDDEVGLFSSSAAMAQAAQLQMFSELIRQYDQGKPQSNESTVAQNGSAAPVARPLVDYPDDDEDEDIIVYSDDNNAAQKAQRPPQSRPEPDSSPLSATSVALATQRYAEKRRREQDDDDDELVKLSSHTKRRSASVSSVSSMGSMSGNAVRKGSIFGSVTESVSVSPDRDSNATTADPAPAVGGGSPTDSGAGTPKKISIKFGNVRPGIKLKFKNPNSKNGNGNGATTVMTTDDAEAGNDMGDNTEHGEGSSDGDGGGDAG